MATSPGVDTEIDGRHLKLSNLDKVLYPESGFTKAEVIDYYARIAPVMVPHVAGRAMTFKRYPNGVEGQSFFEKRCPGHRPTWVDTAIGPGGRGPGSRGAEVGDTVPYCRLDERAALVWAANLAALEFHAPMALAADLDTPQYVVIDLDPGPPADVTDCARVALDLHAVLGRLGLEVYAKTSGSKGMQVYLPLNSPVTHEECADFALALGQLLEKHHPDRVLVNMTKHLRPGKVFIDWSQNSRHKTTIAVYSLRARPRPTVSTPVTWDEVSDGASAKRGTEGALVFEAGDVLRRVDQHGDLWQGLLTRQQALPTRS